MRKYRTISFIITIIFFTIQITAPALAQSQCPETQFTEWGQAGVVTPGEANNLRAKPSAGAELIGQVPPGEPFRVVFNSSTCAGGYLWVEITTPTLTGWTVEIPVGSDTPFIVPYEAPEPREIGALQQDGNYLIDESGIRFSVPAGLNIVRVVTQPEVGLFGEVMSAQPNSAFFYFYIEEETLIGAIEIFPFAITEEAFTYWDRSTFPDLLEEQPPLVEYAQDNRMPQMPIAGVAALFGGAPIYLPFASGEGLRYITYFAQDSVAFDAKTVFTYLYRGLAEDRSYLIAAEFAVLIPEEAIPALLDWDEYAAYLDEFEARLAALPTDAFSPDLSLIDALIGSLTISDADALLELLP